MATATPPIPGKKTETSEQASAAASHAASNEVAAAARSVAIAPPATAPVDPDDAVETVKTPTLLARVQEFRARHEKWEMAGFFFVGFVYDVLTLSRIDDRLTIIQQGVYLLVLASLLLLEQRYPEGVEPPRALAKVWRWREDAIHFFYGSLLSSYTLFFFKSASGLTALLFLVAMFGLLVANELPRFRQLGPVVRVALFSLCVTMYFAYVLPVVIGRLNVWVFLLSLVLGGGAVYGVMAQLRRWGLLDARASLRQIALPGFSIQGALLLLYLLRVIPPVPLAVQFSGIYHEVEKVRDETGTVFRLHHERAWWKFWHHGDQDFRVRPGDKAWYFFSIFAPKGFDNYRVVVRWYYDDPAKGWTPHGRYVATISKGGNERGFRSNAYTSNPRPGDWRVILETEDGHEISRMEFTVEPDERTEPRQFQVFEHRLKDPDKPRT